MSNAQLAQLEPRKFTLNPMFASGGGNSSAFSAMKIGEAAERIEAQAELSDALDEAETDPLQEAFDRGFSAGEAETSAKYEAEAESRKTHIAALDSAFAKAGADEMRGLGEKMQQLVLALCEQSMAPLALDKQALVRRIDAACALMMRAADERQVRLHPDDLALVEEDVPEGLSLVPDGSLARGALRIETSDGGIEDGPATWRAALEEALGIC